MDVVVYFRDGEPLRDHDLIAGSLVEFVRAHPVARCQTWSEDLPAGFSVIRVATPLTNEIPRWRCMGATKEVRLTPRILEARIRAKNRRVTDYRTRVDRVWLLIVSTGFPFSSSFSVPDEINEWRFEFDFDKVLLLSEESGVFNLLRFDSVPQ